MEYPISEIESKKCKKCGSDIKSSVEICNTQYLNAGVLNNSGNRKVIRTSPTCSKCGEGYCNKCLTPAYDIWSHSDLTLCDDCLKQFNIGRSEREEKYDILKNSGKNQENTQSLWIIIMVLLITIVVIFYVFLR
jgi:predicted nucleic acid-binding Zn ribbon protein